jgi:thiol-disulfide isomerase/thioredoxin
MPSRTPRLVAAIVVALVLGGAALALHRPMPTADAAPVGASAPAERAPSPAARVTGPAIGEPAPVWSNTSWLNADRALTLADLRGRVVLVNFWVFTCGNCQRTVPSLVRFDSLYRARGLTIVGIHTPEFPPYAGEHDRGNVARALVAHGIRYPNAQDNDRATWRRYGIRYWPSLVLIDRRGIVRETGVGEFHVGDATDREWSARIEALLAERP